MVPERGLVTSGRVGSLRPFARQAAGEGDVGSGVAARRRVKTNLGPVPGLRSDKGPTSYGQLTALEASVMSAGVAFWRPSLQPDPVMSGRRRSEFLIAGRGIGILPKDFGEELVDGAAACRCWSWAETRWPRASIEPGVRARSWSWTA